MVPRLAAVVTSTNTLLAQVTGNAPGKDVARYEEGRGVRGEQVYRADRKSAIDLFK